MILLEKDPGESRSDFLTRGQFVLDNIGNDSINNLINKSYLFVNIYNHKNKYNSEIEKRLCKNYDCVFY